MKINCAYCGKECDKLSGHVNRARKLGYGVYCNRKCSGLAKKINKSKEQRKKDKAAYDRQYRSNNKAAIKKKKAAYFKADYIAKPDKYKAARASQKENHRKCINRPEYKEYKKNYDQKYLATKKYGEYAEAVIILRQIEDLIDRRMSRQDRDCHNKNQKRKKLWKSYQQLT